MCEGAASGRVVSSGLARQLRLEPVVLDSAFGSEWKQAVHLHCICNATIDGVWQWRRIDGPSPAPFGCKGEHLGLTSPGGRGWWCAAAVTSDVLRRHSHGWLSRFCTRHRWYHHTRMQAVVLTIGAFGAVIGHAALVIQRQFRGYRSRQEVLRIRSRVTRTSLHFRRLNYNTNVKYHLETKGTCNVRASHVHSRMGLVVCLLGTTGPASLTGVLPLEPIHRAQVVMGCPAVPQVPRSFWRAGGGTPACGDRFAFWATCLLPRFNARFESTFPSTAHGGTPVGGTHLAGTGGRC